MEINLRLCYIGCRRGGKIYMCNALEELVNEGVEKGIQKGILANIRTCKTFNVSKSDTIKNLIKEFDLSEDQAKEYVEKHEPDKAQKVLSGSGILFPNGVGSIFMHMNAERSAIAETGLRMYFAAFFPMGMNLLTSYYLQFILRVKQSLCISLLRNVFLSSIAILVFPGIFGGGSLWVVMPIVEFLVLILSMVFLKSMDRQREI